MKRQTTEARPSPLPRMPDIERRQPASGIMPALQEVWRFHQDHFQRRADMGFHQVAAMGRSILLADDVRVHRRFTVVEGNIPNEHRIPVDNIRCMT
jgi:hypothetical protein